MRKSVRYTFAAAILLASAVQMSAGGLFVLLGNPEASPEARAHGAVLTLKLAGCHEPERAEISGTAISIVDGKQQSVPLKLIALSTPGMYAITRQWPATGRSVLQFVARANGGVTSTLVAAGPDGIHRDEAKMAMRMPAAEDVSALLNGSAHENIARK